MSSDIFECTVYGVPYAKERARFYKNGSGQIRSHNTKKAKGSEDYIAKMANRAMIGLDVEVFSCALRATIILYVAIPESWSKKKNMQAHKGEILPTVKPDVDNYIKAVLDALNGVVFLDDKQVIEVLARKEYSTEPRTEIFIEKI